MYAITKSDDGLTPTRRRDIISAIRTTARILNRHPADVPADAGGLRQRLAGIHPQQAGITAKRFANIRSELVAALRRQRRQGPSNNRRRPVSPAWARLWKSIPDKWQRCRMSRLIRFCSGHAIAPDQVTDQTLTAFRSFLAEQSLCKDPERVYKQSIQTWNRLAGRLPGWPTTRLSVQRSKFLWGHKLADFPSSFQEDVSHWLKQLTEVDLLADDGPARPLRPATLNNIQYSIRYFATALVRRGHAIEKITSLAYLVTVEHFKDGLRFFLDRNHGKPPTWLRGMAATMLAIAKYHVRIEAAEVQKLKNITARLSVPNAGLTEKNRARLRQFEDPRNVWLLINLPQRLVERANKRTDPSSWVALEVQNAVAIEILLMAPMRVANLAAIRLDRHLTWYGEGRQRYATLAIPGAEVKNGQPIECTLRPESCALIDTYLKTYRPRLTVGPTIGCFRRGRAGRKRRDPLRTRSPRRSTRKPGSR